MAFGGCDHSSTSGLSSDDSGDEESCWTWQTFLEPLNNQNVQDSNVMKWNPQPPLGSRVGEFIERLQEQHLIKTIEKEEKVIEAKENLEGLSNRSFEELKRHWNAYERALKIKSHLESAGSYWTIQMLARYIKRRDIEFIKPQQRRKDNITEEIDDKYNLSMKAIGGQPRSEYDTRILLDAILQTICVYKKLTIRTEQTIKCNSLPTNKYDYIMYYNNQPTGVVEAKRPGCLIDKSVAQLLVQLLLLSAQDPVLFYFGVLSDGNQFVFAGVREEKVLFFQTNQNKLEIATIRSFQGLGSIVGTMLWLIHDAVTERKIFL